MEKRERNGDVDGERDRGRLREKEIYIEEELRRHVS